jgi:ankyrin repeat protein
MTPLLIAARNGHADAVKALLESGATVNEVSAGDKSSPLVIAIANGHYDVAKFLLEHGADPNLATIDGLAALYAVEDTEYAEVGWAPNPITGQERTTYLDLLKLLLDNKADPNEKLLKALWFRPTSHNEEWVDKKGATPFWRAAMATDVAAMKLLLAGGADPNIASAEGVTPLMVAAGLGWGANASRTVPNGWLPAVQYLVNEVHADVNASDNYGYTALHGAAYRGDNEVVKFLISKGEKLDARSKSGQTLTDMANGPMVNAHLPIEHPETIALLESLGAPPPEVPVAAAPKQGRGGDAAAAATTTK